MKSRHVSIYAVAALALSACMPDYSEGSRVGVVNKLSHKGIMCKSWEGEMNLGGFRNKTNYHTDKDGNSYTSTSVVANVFEFSVQDPKVVAKIQEAMKSGETVELVYTQYLMSPLCKQDSAYTIVEVK